MSITPLSAIVLAAWASASVPISSTTITSGVWFSTASIIISFWNSGCVTCILLAWPIAGWGVSPSPAISLDVSTTTTRLWSSSATRREISLNLVVFPTPGRPKNSILLFCTTKSFMQAIVPVTTLPILQVSPTTFPWRFLIALILCNVPAIPERLSLVNSGTLSVIYFMSSSTMVSSPR